MNDARALGTYVHEYVEKQLRLGGQTSPEAAHRALQDWLGRGRSVQNATRRIRAKSPFNTLQEQQVGLEYEHWRILICCKFLNMTNGRQVRPMIEKFFQACKDPHDVVFVASQFKLRDDVLQMLQPLGFVNRRWQAITQISDWFIEAEDRHFDPYSQENADWVLAIPQCGPYAVDSINVFSYGALEVTSSDTWINDYVNWRRKTDRT